MKTSEQKKEHILRLLQEGKPYREIQKEVGCGAGLISSVKKKANMPIRQSLAPEQPMRSEAASKGDGLTEYLPVPEKPRSAPKASEPSAPAGGTAAQDEVYECGSCGTRWTLEPEEDAVSKCPNGQCGAVFV